jgi:hypothetical protein
MSRKVYEVVVHLSGTQIKYLQKRFPKEWSFTRKLITWKLATWLSREEQEEPRIKEIIEDLEDYYAVPTDPQIPAFPLQ